MKKSTCAHWVLHAIVFLFFSFGATILQAQNAALTVQGILKKADGSAVPDDTYTVRFALFDAEMGGNEIWFEQLTDVETIGGVYSVVLGTHGKTLNAPFDKDYYLSVKVGGSSQELLPRPRLTPAPYALSLVGASAAGIWVGGNNVINATTSGVTINSLLKLPYGFSRTYTSGQPGLSEGTEGSPIFGQLYYGTPPYSSPSYPVTNNYSLETSRVIKVGAVHAMSDRRVKKDFSVSNSANDLALLQRIRVTDYKYKDVVAKGNGLKKGVIAQELEQLVPEAVGFGTDVIPDVYALAQNTRLEAGALRLTMGKPHDLKVGDKVRIMAGDLQEDLPVTAVVSSTEFSLGNWNHDAPEKVFVYGREVNDFHSVDYDHLFTLNISATQELARRVEDLEKENASVKAENAELRRLIDGIRADVNALRGQQR